jgi:hypothetical protein
MQRKRRRRRETAAPMSTHRLLVARRRVMMASLGFCPLFRLEVAGTRSEFGSATDDVLLVVLESEAFEGEVMGR